MGDERFWDFDGDGELNEVEENMMWEDIDDEVNGRADYDDDDDFVDDNFDDDDDYDDDDAW